MKCCDDAIELVRKLTSLALTEQYNKLEAVDNFIKLELAEIKRKLAEATAALDVQRLTLVRSQARLDDQAIIFNRFRADIDTATKNIVDHFTARFEIHQRANEQQEDINKAVKHRLDSLEKREALDERGFNDLIDNILGRLMYLEGEDRLRKQLEARKESETKIKPCPFCGEEGRLEWDVDNDDGKTFFFVQCKYCDAETGNCSDSVCAIEIWNKRV